MKESIRNNIYILLALCALLAAGSCNENNSSYSRPDNMIRFKVSSGFSKGETRTRSGEFEEDDSEGLAPMILSEGKDTLYLHRYVAQEMERTTGSYGGVITRSTPINSVTDFKTLIGEEGFRVMAMFTADDDEYFPLSTAMPIESETPEDIWHVTNPIRYWPDERELHFNAFAPASAEDLFKELKLGEKITFDYTVPVSTTSPRRDAEVQPDIMMASNTYRHTMSGGHSDLVPLNFRHALAAIKFAIRDVINGEIVDITIKGVAGSGSCSFDAENGFNWGNLGATVDYTQTFNYQTTDTYPDTPALGNAPVINTDMPEKTFMLIPQNIPDDAELEITFKIDGEETKTLKGKLKTDDIPLWEAGKEYIYTISTSSENWTYVFNVIGSAQTVNDDDPDKGAFNDDPNNIIVNPTVIENAYYKVQSYRYRTNRPSIQEELTWTAVFTNGKNTIPEEFLSYKDKVKSELTPEEWFTTITYNGEGSTEPLKYDVVFNAQYVATNWSGDWEMRSKKENGTKDEPIDLSMRNGGMGVRNTANCYVVNAGGWYTIPLYYGNSITNGQKNERAYKYLKTDLLNDNGKHTENGYTSLMKFVNHKGLPIETPEITGADNATLVWQDAYGIFDHIELAGNVIKFHIAHENLQQSNSVIAVRDNNNNIMWSWHIWVTEHWVDDNLVLNQGIINCDAWDEDMGTFDVAPRNLGWCDPKNVQYLERTGELTFTQEQSDKEHKLKVTQRGKLIQYWIGNNTYYQFGRKDPMVGFRNTDNQVKYNFGPMKYEKEAINNKEIKDGILRPNVLFGGVDAGLNSNDWLKAGLDYYNLWNNYSASGNYLTGEFEPKIENGKLTGTTATPILTKAFAYSAVKTVYDPSPAGYVVPPVSFFNLFTKGRAYADYANADNVVSLADFNGEAEWIRKEGDRNFFTFYAYPKRNGINGDKILLTGTGHRWYRNSLPWGLGGNFNPHYIYLWSNSCSFTMNDRGAFSLAIGQDINEKQGNIDIKEQKIFIITSHLIGRKNMARPVRCVKEFQ